MDLDIRKQIGSMLRAIFRIINSETYYDGIVISK